MRRVVGQIDQSDVQDNIEYQCCKNHNEAKRKNDDHKRTDDRSHHQGK
ncbi:hypothetical protein [Aureibaculum algae]|nr:hypothetical protein [Aureibaculum algae]